MMHKLVLATGFLLLAVLAGCTDNNIPEEVVAPTPEPAQEFAQPVEDGTYELDTEHSELTYFSTYLVGNSHTGTVDIQEGSLTIAQGEGTGDFVIDMTTITDTEGNERYLGHVASDDFFGVEQFPTSRFSITSIEPLSDGQYSVTGDLTIRDQTHEITFPATGSVTDNRIVVDAEFAIDRTRWGITFRSNAFFADLGDRAIRDDVDFSLHLEFIR